MDRGTTLAELTLVVALLGILTTVAAPRLLGGADRWLVREAREEVVGLLYRARLEARLAGESSLVVRTGGGAELRTPLRDDPLRWEPGAEGVTVEVAGGREEVELRFGPSGAGRVASATLLFKRGRAESSLVISSYGRVRR